jgi:hypothetical protein
MPRKIFLSLIFIAVVGQLLTTRAAVAPALADISDKTTNEETPITITFGVDANSPPITAVTAFSANQTLVPDANLVLSGTGNTRSLQITPATDQTGAVLITVNITLLVGGTLTDTFTLTVTPVNDAPTFTIGPNQTVREDVGFQFVSGWATNMSDGPNETGETSFQVINNTNPGLFLRQPSVEANGLLQYTLLSDVNGSADITIVLKDTGGTANGGVDTSAPQTFTITVTPFNDAPLIALQAPFVQTTQSTPISFSSANSNGIGLSDIDLVGATDAIRVTLTATHGTLTLPSTGNLTFVTGDGVNDETMTFTGLISPINFRLSGLTFKPEDAFVGTATLEIVVNDQGHNGAGGPQSTTRTITIEVVSPVLLTEQLTDHAIALDLVTHTRDPFTLTNPFNLSADHARRISLFVWRLGLLPNDTLTTVQVVARDDEGRFYDLPVEALITVEDVTQVVVRLPDSVTGAPRDLRVKVTLRASSNEAFIKIQ